ncbi:MAG TPA: TrkH family potassium uptake protein [Oscillospiraceae bacterium]|nr:TrkH family potassium uptake protein [Oscillospiraceae bacterium]
MPVLQHAKLKPMKPMRTIVLSFLLVISVGTLLLSLPISSKARECTPFIESFFTATSATCVTGLVVYDTYTHWSIFGQVIILLLIQIGGLGLVTFTSFFNFIIGRKLGLRSIQLASENANSTGFTDVKALVSAIFKISVFFETIGAILLMSVFVPKYGPRGIFISFFLSISAFCNAGFDILGNEGEYISLMNYADNPIVMLTIMGLIICGGLGFVVWYDIMNYRKTKKLILHSKVVIFTTAFLIVSGAALVLILEWSNPNTMVDDSVGKKIWEAFFQSVSFRTAGFNTIDIAGMHSSTKLVGIIYMFIGAAPGSTGGGIKVSTITVIIMTVISVIKNNPDTVIHGRRIDKDTVYKSLSILMLSMLVVIFTSCFVYYSNVGAGAQGIDSVFESVSAFATVGLSAGTTALTNGISRLILSFAMFIGRVGPVSLALSIAIGLDARNKNQVIPEGKVLVG